jgi:seryl-tRNA synthetase
MLQVNLIKQNPDEVKRKLAVKNFKDLNLVDEIISLDEARRKLSFQFDETKAGINAASKEIGQLMSKGQKQEADTRKKEVEAFKLKLDPIQQELETTERKLTDLLLRLPNLPSEKVPAGKTPEDNEVVRTGGIKPE